MCVVQNAQVRTIEHCRIAHDRIKVLKALKLWTLNTILDPTHTLVNEKLRIFPMVSFDNCQNLTRLHQNFLPSLGLSQTQMP